jgi:hypothetical protein
MIPTKTDFRIAGRLPGRPASAGVILLLALGAGAAWPQGTGAAAPSAAFPPAGEQPAAGPWVEVRGELFARFHFFPEESAGSSGAVRALHSTRLDLSFRPSSRLAVHLQGQDSRAWGFGGGKGQADPLDLKVAFAEIGLAEGWTLRAGRQEMAFGDERLIGSDRNWCHLGLSFDAVRLSFERGGARIDAFASAPVARSPGKWNGVVGAEKLHGIYTSWKVAAGDELDVYALWRSAPESGGGPGGRRGSGRYTAGSRYAKELAGGWDVATEMAVQWGSDAGGAIRAWAGHWEAGRSFGHRARGPRVAVEYNAASGDSRPDDGFNESFDDLFPAGHDAYGLPDPVPWSGMHSLGGSVEWAASRNVAVVAGGRAVWAPAADGAGGRHLGGQFAVRATWQPWAEWELFAGFSYLSPGIRSGYGGPHSMPFAGVRHTLGR